MFHVCWNSTHISVTLVFHGRYIVKRWVKVSEAVLVAAMSAVMAFLLIFLVDDCVPNKPDSEHESHVQVSSQWSVVSGQSSVVSGQWSVVQMDNRHKVSLEYFKPPCCTYMLYFKYNFFLIKW